MAEARERSATAESKSFERRAHSALKSRSSSDWGEKLIVEVREERQRSTLGGVDDSALRAVARSFSALTTWARCQKKHGSVLLVVR